MNPQMIESYTVGAYWLQAELHNPKEAQAFLFEGLRNNPGNSELLFDLGRLYNEGYHDPNRARNVWLAGLRCWEAQGADVKTNVQSQYLCEEITMNLARLEETEGHWPQAVQYMESVKQISTDPEAIQKQIDEAKKKIAGQPGASKP
jgi:hypothetical protein